MSQQRAITSFFSAGARKSSSAAAAAAAPKAGAQKRSASSKEIDDFDKDKRRALSDTNGNTSTPVSPSSSSSSSSTVPQEQLTPEQIARMEQSKMHAALKLAGRTGVPSPNTMGASWRHALRGEFSKPYFNQIQAFLASQRTAGKRIFPPAPDVFSFTRACEIRDVRVVILGQDPYHGPNQAHGLCFSVRPGVRVPPSLRNMYKLLESDVSGFHSPNHGYLGSWADQGVLLLNAVLTVEQAKANAHKDKGWERLTDAIVSWISTHCDDVVFMLWGSYAQKKGAKVDTRRHCVLKTVHPSPLSAHRGFFQSAQFSKANAYLAEKGRGTIDWTSVCKKEATEGAA